MAGEALTHLLYSFGHYPDIHEGEGVQQTEIEVFGNEAKVKFIAKPKPKPTKPNFQELRFSPLVS